MKALNIAGQALAWFTLVVLAAGLAKLLVWIVTG